MDAIEIADLIAEGRNTFRLVASEFLVLRQQMADTFGAMSETVDTTTRILNEAGENVQMVTSVSRGLMEDARAMVLDTRGIVTDLAAGQGTVGKLLTDEAFYGHLAGAARETEATMRAVRGSAEEVEALVAGFGGPDGKGTQLLATAGDVVVHARNAMSDLAENTEAMKRNWLFRSFFADRGFYNLDELTLDEYRELWRDDRYTPLRIWLDAEVLFDADGDRVILREDAAVRLDEAMGELLDYPRDSPLVVEGYAVGQGRSREFVRAGAQAEVVRDYLARTFGRDVRLTGTMPIGADAAGSPTGDGRWEGVALTLFVDSERLARTEGASSAP